MIRSSWAREETPDGKEMSRAVDDGRARRHPPSRVHVIANRVDPETWKATKLGSSDFRLSRWVEGYEREQGRIRVANRVRKERAAKGGQGGAPPDMGPVASMGALPLRGHAAQAGEVGEDAGATVDPLATLDLARFVVAGKRGPVLSMSYSRQADCSSNARKDLTGGNRTLPMPPSPAILVPGMTASVLHDEYELPARGRMDHYAQAST